MSHFRNGQPSVRRHHVWQEILARFPRLCFDSSGSGDILQGLGCEPSDRIVLLLLLPPNGRFLHAVIPSKSEEIEYVFRISYPVNVPAKIFNFFNADLVVKCGSDQLKGVGSQLDAVPKLLLDLRQVLVHTKLFLFRQRTHREVSRHRVFSRERINWSTLEDDPVGR